MKVKIAHNARCYFSKVNPFGITQPYSEPHKVLQAEERLCEAAKI